MGAERKTTEAAADAQPTELLPGPALPSLDELRAMVREEVQAALAGFADELQAGIVSLDEQPAEPAELQARTIRHDMFTYDLPNGGQAIARRGDTVDLLPHDIERGHRFEAFTAKPGLLPEPAASTLPAFPLDGSMVEHDAWVGSGSVQEIITAVNLRPEILTTVVAAEQRRGDAARSTLLDALAKLSIA